MCYTNTTRIINFYLTVSFAVFSNDFLKDSFLYNSRFVLTVPLLGDDDDNEVLDILEVFK